MVNSDTGVGQGGESPQFRRVAVIDLGSNSTLLLVLGRSGERILERVQITRLGAGVFADSVLRPEARDRTARAVADFAAAAREAGAEIVVGVGTEALRQARDGRAYLEQLVSAGSLDRAELLSGEREAGFALEAARRSGRDRRDPPVVVDVGGGSTEIAWMARDTRAVHARSLPLGSVRLTEAYLPEHPIPAAALARARAEIVRCLAPLRAGGADAGARDAARRSGVVAVAGTATTLAAMDQALVDYDADRVEGYALELGTLQRWIARLAGLTVAQRRELPGLEPGRADVIVAGLCVLEGVLRTLAVASFRSSGRGVRYGAALQLLDGKWAV